MNDIHSYHKKKNITTIEEANLYLNDVFIPKYNARFALLIDNNRNCFISLDKSFNYNKELAVWSEHEIYHNSYLKYDKQYHIILDRNQKYYIPFSGKIKVYTFLDGSNHILFEDKWYDIKTIRDYQTENKQLSYFTKTQESS